MNELKSEKLSETTSQFPFDILRFKKLLIALSLFLSLILYLFDSKSASFGVICGSALFLLTFSALHVFKDVVLGSKDFVKILILLLKYPAIFASLYLISISGNLISFSVGYLLFLPALCIESLLSSRG